ARSCVRRHATPRTMGACRSTMPRKAASSPLAAKRERSSASVFMGGGHRIHVAIRPPGTIIFRKVSGGGVKSGGGEEVLQIERAGEHGQSAVCGARPRILRSVPVEFHAVFVRVTKIERFADTVVGGTVQNNAGIQDAAQSAGQIGPGGVENGVMEQ